MDRLVSDRHIGGMVHSLLESPCFSVGEDDSGSEVLRAPRAGGTAYVTSPGELMPVTTYQLRVEIHDSDLFETLDNRSNGERLTFTTGDLPGPPSGSLTVIPVPWVATAPLIPHDTYNGKEITFKAMALGL